MFHRVEAGERTHANKLMENNFKERLKKYWENTQKYLKKDSGSLYLSALKTEQAEEAEEIKEMKITEGPILEPERILEAREEEPKKKYDFYVELVLFLILGILVGIALKTEAVKRITIGYDDYKMKIMKSDFDINKIEKDILQKQEAESK
ncbi:MAG: hypothetical protein A2271_01570 [Candidatus Moranbacteria bacterium RIFOXYA12_FULL_35_19]|nr:MAG: hypothetical protein A2489_00610 [Candidatus Moranbacteria bacterium RIFOXYC12_FULL_36_13]OGI33160.1 MAG: hypothetical protein A2343_02900 [Candidatus Moranbacteria bacterium RIFOXYB12_FULL_35_8]OGI35973.1 MAG: hypothetical protein A2271_01570 [Candidatus Moranbacteria bacterium RIFOXYA12_FULL_35_19]